MNGAPSKSLPQYSDRSPENRWGKPFCHLGSTSSLSQRVRSPRLYVATYPIPIMESLAGNVFALRDNSRIAPKSRWQFRLAGKQPEYTARNRTTKPSLAPPPSTDALCAAPPPSRGVGRQREAESAATGELQQSPDAAYGDESLAVAV